jgi:hypothetical protein
MSEQQSGTGNPAALSASPYGYPYWEWVAREDPEYVKARQPLSDLSVGEGRELSIKYRELRHASQPRQALRQHEPAALETAALRLCQRCLA